MTDTSETPSDDELLALSLSGDENAFRLLYDRLKDPIFRYAFYMTGSRSAAEEILQEVFMALLRNRHRYNSAQGDLPGFVFGIARNLVRRYRKRKRLSEELPGDAVLEKISGSLPGTELPAQLMRYQGVEKLRAAIATLPEHYRQVIVLCDLCELTYAEVALRLECAVGTVRSRLNRAHALLAQKLKQAGKPQSELPAAGTEEYVI